MSTIEGQSAELMLAIVSWVARRGGIPLEAVKKIPITVVLDLLRAYILEDIARLWQEGRLP